jgi:hypothetical protein
MPSRFSPILIRNQRDWIYSLGDQQQHVNFKCLMNNTWVTSSLVLHGSGVLHNASDCYIVGRNFQLYPALQGHTNMAVHHHANMVIQHINPLTSEEIQKLKLSTNLDVTQLDQLASEAKDHLHRDVNKMLELRESHKREQSIHYTAWYIAVPSILTILFTIIICYGKPKLCRRLSSMIARSKKCNNPIPRNSPPTKSENPNSPLAEATSLAKKHN